MTDKYNIGIIVVATGNYVDMVDENKLIKSLLDNFLVNHNRTIYLFTDGRELPDTAKIAVDHQPWPYPTLHRFHFITDNRKIIEHTDYLYYIDADMLIVDKIEDDILGDLVTTIHPSRDKYIRKNRFPFETRPESTAYFDSKDYKNYFTGAFYGGKSDCFLKMCAKLKENVDIDHSHNLIAVWHDESHLNCYCFHNKPTKILNEAYAYRWDKHFIFDKKIIPINHFKYRR